jgi:hypothetical protein
MVCTLCGREFQRASQGRRPHYCSIACRQRAYRFRQAERLWHGSSSGSADPRAVANLLDGALNRHLPGS